ncbi:hypothetical protein Csa_019150, partial [Cucumis sativus]
LLISPFPQNPKPKEILSSFFVLRSSFFILPFPFSSSRSP